MSFSSRRLRSVFAQAQHGAGKNKLELVAEVYTRWGSRYDMLNRFLQLKDAVKSTAAKLTEDEKKKNDKMAVSFLSLLPFVVCMCCLYCLLILILF